MRHKWLVSKILGNRPLWRRSGRSSTAVEEERSVFSLLGPLDGAAGGEVSMFVETLESSAPIRRRCQNSGPSLLRLVQGHASNPRGAQGRMPTAIGARSGFGRGLRVGAAIAILGLTLSLVAGSPPAYATPTTVTFSYTGSLQTWTVPTGVTSLQVTLDGAQGSSSYGGFGGQVQGVIPVTAGSVLNIYVGGQGSGTTGGFNGGGGGNFNHPSGAAGGASDIRIGGMTLADRAIIAGGGGGPGASNDDGPIFGLGGSGGGVVGEAGDSDGSSEGGGGGGTQSSGGTAGAGGYSAAGVLGQGAGGAANGGDGGGGYYGGGSGGTSGSGGAAGGGGGGSSYAELSATSVSYIHGYQTGNGQVLISWPASGPSVPSSPSSQTVAFSYTGAPQLWTVPAGVSEIGVVAAGGSAGVPVLVVVGAVGPDGISGRAGAEVVVRSLTDRFGEAQALADPAACVEVVVADALGELWGGGPAS